MVVYDIADDRIRLRQAGGDQFEFAIVDRAEPPTLRLCGRPRWAAGGQPANAEFRVYLARMAAQSLARDARRSR